LLGFHGRESQDLCNGTNVASKLANFFLNRRICSLWCTCTPSPCGGTSFRNGQSEDVIRAGYPPPPPTLPEYIQGKLRALWGCATQQEKTLLLRYISLNVAQWMNMFKFC
jgi:hypothetical protein